MRNLNFLGGVREPLHGRRVAACYVEPCGDGRGRVSATIILARHGSHAEVGRVLSGRSAISLDAPGVGEAERLASHFVGREIAAIHCSPRPRARETAQAVATRLDLPVIVADALDEVDFGSWTGMTFAELDGDPAWRDWNAERATAPTPGGETMTAAVARAVAYVQAIGAAGPVLCISHCDIIRGLVAHFLGLSLNRILAFDCDPASLTTLELGDGGGRVVALNERPSR